jgi:hypothetical protein
MAEHIGDCPELADVTGASNHVSGRGVAKPTRCQAWDARSVDQDLKCPVQAARHYRPAGVRGDEEVMVLPLRTCNQPLSGLCLAVACEHSDGLGV